MAKTPEKITIKTFINPITLPIALILLVGLILAGLAALLLGRQPAATGAVVPAVTRIAAPTQTPRSAAPTAFPTPTATSVFFLPDGVVGVGAYVQVAGTQGAGLRMRSGPGLDGEVNFTALDSEVFLVIDGPVEADGYTWWHLEAPYDQTRNGWSAGDFLTPIEEEGD
ncbi:MAG: SH3 domain-containing protein [Chloroflexota bacterium]|nr:SH3 domain-containing protein [Chloroflexota bacterium]